MPTLVTGAGLIGASFAQHAAHRGEEVVFLDPIPREAFLAAKLGDAPFQIVADDVRQLPALVETCRSRRIETIVHTASRIGHRAANPLHEGFSLNIGGTQAVAEAARLAGVRRLVHISTFGAYDWRRPMPEPVREDFPRGSGVPYGNFKAAQELILEAYQKVYGFELIILRPANTFGVGHFWAGSGGGEKVQDLIVAGLAGERARIPEEQTMAFEYVYAKDVGRAVDLAATCAMPKQFIFNVGTGVTTGFEALVAAIKRKLPALDVEIVPGTPPVSRTQHLDLSAAAEHLGWSPQFSLDTGLDDYIADLKALRDRP
jgi:UDP-glucose 4-epimerase